MHAALALAAAWFTYVNPFTLQIRTDAGWTWLSLVLASSAAAAGYAFWSITTGDRRAWMRAFHDTAPDPLESATAD